MRGFHSDQCFVVVQVLAKRRDLLRNFDVDHRQCSMRHDASHGIGIVLTRRVLEPSTTAAAFGR
jgi:hypothetical protein